MKHLNGEKIVGNIPNNWKALLATTVVGAVRSEYRFT